MLKLKTECLKKSIFLYQTPPLEIPITTQESTKLCQPTESEIFYRQALVNKLQQLNDSIVSSDEQNSETTLILPDRTNRKFNLNAYLSQLVYPAECLNENSETLLNASYIVDHLSSELNGKRGGRKSSSNRLADISVVDEEMVLNLSQKVTRNDICKLN